MLSCCHVAKVAQSSRQLSKASVAAKAVKGKVVVTLPTGLKVEVRDKNLEGTRKLLAFCQAKVANLEMKVSEGNETEAWLQNFVVALLNVLEEEHGGEVLGSILVAAWARLRTIDDSGGLEVFTTCSDGTVIVTPSFEMALSAPLADYKVTLERLEDRCGNISPGAQKAAGYGAVAKELEVHLEWQSDSPDPKRRKAGNVEVEEFLPKAPEGQVPRAPVPEADDVSLAGKVWDVKYVACLGGAPAMTKCRRRRSVLIMTLFLCRVRRPTLGVE
jgi:hypothetical protein